MKIQIGNIEGISGKAFALNGLRGYYPVKKGICWKKIHNTWISKGDFRIRKSSYRTTKGDIRISIILCRMSI